MRTSVRQLLVGILFALAAPGPAAQTGSQAAPQAPPRQQPIRTEANFVRVDAYPMKGGSPVLDLTAAEFEVLEDGVPQKVETFEHVVVRPAGPQSERIEPGSQREMLQAAGEARNRVFVIFLDAPHVTVAGSHDIAGPLIRLVNRILGPDDLVGIMTPAMSADSLVLARRTEVTEEQLRRHWPWGQRFSLMRDKQEEAYAICYPPLSGESTESELARTLIARKRERATLEAMQDLVRYLHGIREERKAILAVTEGWLLYRPDQSIMKLRQDKDWQEPIPGVDPIGVGPTGKPTTKDPRNLGNLTMMECNTDRMRLAMMDNERFLRDIIDEANRANASFYPIDPRGLPVFDNAIGPDAPPPVSVDHRMLTQRLEGLRTLALNTDGIAVLNNNDLDKGMRRISDDLTSYYLLGYYSSNPKLDGGFRSLKVKVTRPGVDVRARRGYRAASMAEITAARTAAAAPLPEAAGAVKSAMGNLARSRPDSRLMLNASASAPAGLVWVTGELSAAATQGGEWAQGGTADIQITSGAASSSSRVALKPGERSFLTVIKLPAGTAATLDVQARLASIDRTAAPATEMIRVPLSPAGVQPLIYRRGPSTGNRQQPTADLRFTRADRVHLEIPVASDAKPAGGRLLDAMGKPLDLPVTVGERADDPSGQRWVTADVGLAPLAPADYAIEIGMVTGGTDTRVVTAIRVVR